MRGCELLKQHQHSYSSSWEPNASSTLSTAGLPCLSQAICSRVKLILLLTRMFCWFVLSTSCKPLSPHFPAPWQRSSSSSLLRDCFLKSYQLSLTFFWLLLSPSLHFFLSPSSIPFPLIPYPGDPEGEPVDTICKIFIGMDRSFSCPHCPQLLGTFSDAFLLPFNILLL